MPLAEGNNAITAFVVDGDGAAATASIDVFRDTTAPPISIDSPLDGAILNGLTVDVAGMVFDLGMLQSVTVNGLVATVVGTDYSLLGLSLLEGAHLIEAVAIDSVGNTATASVTVTVQVPEPGTLALLGAGLLGLSLRPRRVV